MFEKPSDTSTPIQPLLQQRWSGVAFDADRQVDATDLRAMLEAARWAPSCYGEQPWRYLICDKSATPLAWQHAFDALKELNQVWCQSVPVLIAACAKTHFSHNDAPNPWAVHDTGAASLSLCLEATARGLMTHQMAGFDPEKLRAAFEIPAAFQPVAMIAVGYQVPQDAIPEALKPRELAPRQRKPLETLAFAGQWGTGI